MAWGTIARWLESAATYAARFNDRMLKGFVIRELQADEIRTFVGAKKRVNLVLTNLEVWSRLWISVEIGRRNFQNIKRVVQDTLLRGRMVPKLRRPVFRGVQIRPFLITRPKTSTSVLIPRA